MKKWFKRNGLEFIFGIGVSLFFINFFTEGGDDLYIISIPLVVYGLIRLYQRHFGPRYYSSNNSSFAYSFDDGDAEDLYEDAKDAVIEAGRASTSYLQRKLRVGYSRAARLMDMLEEEGVIGPAIGSQPRDILKKDDSQ